MSIDEKKVVKVMQKQSSKLLLKKGKASTPHKNAKRNGIQTASLGVFPFSGDLPLY